MAHGVLLVYYYYKGRQKVLSLSDLDKRQTIELADVLLYVETNGNHWVPSQKNIVCGA